MCEKLLFTIFLLFICLDALFMGMNSAPDAGLKKKKKKKKQTWGLKHGSKPTLSLQCKRLHILRPIILFQIYIIHSKTPNHL